VRQLATSSVMPACTQGQGRQGLGQGGGGARGRARGRAALVWHHLAMSPLPDEQISSTAATTSSSNNPPHAYAQVAFAPPPSLRTRFRPQQLACARTAVLVRCGQQLPHRWPGHHAKGASRKLQPIYGMAHPLQKLSQVGWGHGSVVSPPACRHMLTAGKPRVGGECAGRPPGSGYHPAGPLAHLISVSPWLLGLGGLWLWRMKLQGRSKVPPAVPVAAAAVPAGAAAAAAAAARQRRWAEAAERRASCRVACMPSAGA
jgi:hypothetical protein